MRSIRFLTILTLTFISAEIGISIQAVAPNGVISNIIQITDAEGCYGDLVTLELLLENTPNEIDCFTIYLSFDPAVLQYSSCSQGSLVPEDGWIMYGCNEPDPGVLILGAFSDLKSLLPGSTGSLWRIDFNVICETCSEGQVSEIIFEQLLDDLVGYIGDDGTVTYPCPGPTATATATVAPSTPTPTQIPNVPATDSSGIMLSLMVMTFLLTVAIRHR